LQGTNGRWAIPLDIRIRPTKSTEIAELRGRLACGVGVAGWACLRLLPYRFANPEPRDTAPPQLRVPELAVLANDNHGRHQRRLLQHGVGEALAAFGVHHAGTP
jgi:hypothetical protein